MYCIIRCIVQGKQARVKNADLRHPSCTVVMQKRKSASPVLSVLRNAELPATNAGYIQRAQAMHVYRNIEVHSPNSITCLSVCLYFCLSCRQANHIFLWVVLHFQRFLIKGTIFSKKYLA